MRKFAAVHVPILSFFSRDLYSDLALNWRGVNFLYLFLLLAVCWIPLTVIIDTSFSQFVKKQVPQIVNQIPKITVTNGEVSIDEPQPYYINNPDNNKVAAIIDTTGKTTSLDNTDAVILITKNNVMLKERFQTRIMSLTGIKNLVITREDINNWVEIFRKFFVFAIYPILVIGSFIFRILQVLIYSAIGLIFCSWCKVNLEFSALLRLSVAAVTPCIIINTLLTSSGRFLPYAGLIYFLLAMMYLFFGVKATADEMANMETVEPPENEPV